MDAIDATVRQYILDEFLPGAQPSELTDTTPLVSGGIVDSVATLKLVSFLEERFGIVIEPHEASVDHLDSVRQIAALVRRKQGA